MSETANPTPPEKGAIPKEAGPVPAEDPFLAEAPERRWWRPWSWSWRRLWRWRVSRMFLVAILILVLAYYPVGMIWISKIDDDPSFDPGPVQDGSSHAVAMAAALIDREVNKNDWPANDPFFYPGAALDNMPNFQIGIIAALGRFAVEMTDQIGRTRGSSQADP